MQLSLHAEYAFRVLLYVGAHPNQVVTTRKISDAYGISRHHLVRVVQTLGECGYLRLIPGRSGGLSLAIAPELIRLGEVVSKAEPDLRLAECFDHAGNACVITPLCSLRPVLNQALEAFLKALNEYTLADLLARGTQRKLAAAFATIAGAQPITPQPHA